MHAWERLRAAAAGRPMRLGLERVRRSLDALELPPPPPRLVVAGTNGKGSTCRLLDAMLRAAGYRVGLYTSPHLLSFRERIALDGVAASDAVLDASFARVAGCEGAEQLTEFEFDTLAAFAAFGAQRLDAWVLEVGLGGRLDAVNAIDADCAIVTSIGIDHAELLGPTREHVGFEKAHVYRAGRPAICADPDPPQSLLEVARSLGADLRCLRRDFHVEEADRAGPEGHWSFRGRGLRRSGLPYPALRGPHQLRNAAAALAALEAVAERLPIGQQAVREGLVGVRWAGRFQVLPGRPTIVLDVAHNPQAAAALGDTLDRQGYFRQTIAVFGMLRDKDAAGVVDAIAARIDRWELGSTTGPRGQDAGALAAVVRARAGGREAALAVHPRVADALQAARGRAGPDDRILVFGSFVTVAEAMKVLNVAADPVAAD